MTDDALMLLHAQHGAALEELMRWRQWAKASYVPLSRALHIAHLHGGMYDGPSMPWRPE